MRNAWRCVGCRFRVRGARYVRHSVPSVSSVSKRSRGPFERWRAYHRGCKRVSHTGAGDAAEMHAIGGDQPPNLSASLSVCLFLSLSHTVAQHWRLTTPPVAANLNDVLAAGSKIDRACPNIEAAFDPADPAGSARCILPLIIPNCSGRDWQMGRGVHS